MLMLLVHHDVVLHHDVAAADATFVAFAAVVVATIDVDVDVAITQYISCKIAFIGIRSLLP